MRFCAARRACSASSDAFKLRTCEYLSPRQPEVVREGGHEIHDIKFGFHLALHVITEDWALLVICRGTGTGEQDLNMRGMLHTAVKGNYALGFSETLKRRTRCGRLMRGESTSFEK